MEQKDRDKICFHCDKVVSKINISKLWPKLLEHKIYNPDDVNIPRWEKNLTDIYTIKDIFLKIQTRGPKAYERLLLSLKESGHKNICDILENKIELRNHDNSNDKNDNTYIPVEGRSFYHDIQQSNEPLKINLQKATKYMVDKNSKIPLYPMQSNPRGLVLLITNIHYNSPEEEPRLSAEHDENNLTELFKEMGFRVISKRNLTGKDIKDEVKEFSRRSDLEDVDSCFVIISSHGKEDENNHTEIQGVDSGKEDYEKVLSNDILDYFTVEACPKMAGKPKIFIFQLCRGLRKQKVSYERFVTDTCVTVFPKDVDEEVKPNSKMLSDPEYSIRNYADMLVVYSTLPGHVAYRDITTGSWFIQILCSVFMTLAHECHVQDLFNIIDSELQHLRTEDDNCQTSTVKSIGFNRHCYLNPGYFSDQFDANKT